MRIQEPPSRQNSAHILLSWTQRAGNASIPGYDNHIKFIGKLYVHFEIWQPQFLTEQFSKSYHINLIANVCTLVPSHTINFNCKCLYFGAHKVLNFSFGVISLPPGAQSQHYYYLSGGGLAIQPNTPTTAMPAYLTYDTCTYKGTSLLYVHIILEQRILIILIMSYYHRQICTIIYCIHYRMAVQHT